MRVSQDCQDPAGEAGCGSSASRSGSTGYPDYVGARAQHRRLATDGFDRFEQGLAFGRIGHPRFVVTQEPERPLDRDELDVHQLSFGELLSQFARQMEVGGREPARVRIVAASVASRFQILLRDRLELRLRCQPTLSRAVEPAGEA